MNKELKLGIIAALENKPSANFSAEDVNTAAINAIMQACGLTADSSAREIRAKEDMAFALIEEAVDEILPKKLEQVLGGFAEIRTFPRDAEVVFNIEKIGKQRAKLTIAKGARGGIYRAARLDSKFFSPSTSVYTASVYVTLEELILGTASLGELYANILEGFEEIVYKEVFNALATGADAAGYGRIVDGASNGASDHNFDANRNILTTKATLGGALDMVMPYVKQYGIPTIFGSYRVLSALRNGVIGTNLTPDVEDVRRYGFVQEYKGVKVLKLSGQSFNICVHRVFNFDFNMNGIANEILNNPEQWSLSEGSNTISTTLITDRKIAALFRPLQREHESRFYAL